MWHCQRRCCSLRMSLLLSSLVYIVYLHLSRRKVSPMSSSIFLQKPGEIQNWILTLFTLLCIFGFLKYATYRILGGCGLEVIKTCFLLVCTAPDLTESICGNIFCKSLLFISNDFLLLLAAAWEKKKITQASTAVILKASDIQGRNKLQNVPLPPRYHEHWYSD